MRAKFNQSFKIQAVEFVVAFQYRNEARQFYRELPKRLQKFNLDVAPDKTHLLRFSRFHPGKLRHLQFRTAHAVQVVK
ncbi:hypothetical protein MNBD_GAMMA24-126 [hydrothermal vent metagenome]|uniref:Uncharacterized protein n=1 Tax=hydrothermal vent metagenome TaxID=652676 RepID=A0A3B1BLS6_9ZZZZ